MARWDLSSSTLLVTVSLLTPLEAGFLPCAEPLSPLWTVNMLTNLFFTADMILQFFLPYSMPTRFGRRLIVSHQRIIMNYLSSWFLVDFLSVIPWELLSGDCRPGEQKMSMGMLRAIRLLRLMKLLRLVRGLRMFKRWQADFGFSLRKWMLYQLLGMVLIVSHWFACALGVLSRLQALEICAGDPKDYKDGCKITWLTTAQRSYDYDDNPSGELSPLNAYLYSFHASMSILVHPHSYRPTGPVERAFFCILMLAGGFIWTQVISRSTAMITSLNKHHIAYQTTMDDLNMLSAEKGLSYDMQRRLRRFFLSTKDTSQYDTWQAIVRKMSPKLRRDCGREINKFWVLKVRFLSRCNIVIVTDVAEKLQLTRYSETETFGDMHKLYILMEGTVMLSRKAGLVQTSGAVWGEDHLLLSSPELLSDNTAAALLFVQCHVLEKKTFDKILANFPDQQPIVRRAAVRLAVIRGIKMYAEELLKEQRKKAREDEQEECAGHKQSLVGIEHLDEHVQDALMVQSKRKKSFFAAKQASTMARTGSLEFGSESNPPLSGQVSQDLPPEPHHISTPADEEELRQPTDSRAYASATEVDVLVRRVEELATQQSAMRQLVESSFAALAEGLGELQSSQPAFGALRSGRTDPTFAPPGEPLPLGGDPGPGHGPPQRGVLRGNPLGACS